MVAKVNQKIFQWRPRWSSIAFKCFVCSKGRLVYIFQKKCIQFFIQIFHSILRIKNCSVQLQNSFSGFSFQWQKHYEGSFCFIQWCGKLSYLHFFFPCTVVKVKLATIVEGDPKAPFSIATTPRYRGGRYSFPGLLYFTLDPYLIMLSVKQGGIKYHFLSLWYDSTRDWTQVSRPIGEHSNC